MRRRVVANIAGDGEAPVWYIEVFPGRAAPPREGWYLMHLTPPLPLRGGQEEKGRHRMYASPVWPATLEEEKP